MEGLVPGRVVYYVFSEGGAVMVDAARQRFGYTGSPVRAGDICPAMVVRVVDLPTGVINLKVMLDGPDTYWATSAQYDAAKTLGHSWHWMFDGQQKRYTPDRVAKEA